MPDNKVETQFTGDATDILRALQQQQRETTKLQREMLNLAKESKKATKESAGGFQMVLGSLKKIGGAIIGGGGVLAAFGMMRSANQDIIDQAEEAGKKWDDFFRKFRVQSGLRGLESESAQTRIAEIATRQAVPIEQASAAATQLVSSGFSAEEASGGSLEEFLRALNATNVRGGNVDATSLAKSLANYLQSQGLEKNEANVSAVGRGTQSLFKGTNLQLPALEDIGKIGAGLRGALDQREQFAAYASLVDILPGAEAAVGLRNFVSMSSTISASKDKVESLAAMKLKPEDVDFVGENLDQVLAKFQAGVQSVPEEQRKPLLTKIFGLESVTPALHLLATRDRIKSNVELQKDTSGFLPDVEEATSGRNAAAVRQQNERERRRVAHDALDDLTIEELDALMEERGVSPFRRGVNTFGFRQMRNLGFSPETSLRFMPGGEDTRDTVIERRNLMQQGAGKQPVKVEVINQRPNPPVKQKPAAAGAERR